MVERLLITGGCGFIGRSLIRHLKAAQPDVAIRVLDNLSVGTRDDLEEVTAIGTAPGEVELHVGDITQAASVHRATAGCTAIVHLAANTGVQPSIQDPELDLRSNVIGTFHLLEAMRREGVKRFVFASSGAPVGETEPPIHEELAPHPVSPYGASKLAGEGYCSAYFHSFGCETVALRFGNVYGPLSGHKGSVVAKFVRRAMAGQNLQIYGDGEQTRDFIYIDDLVQALIAALTTPNVGGQVFQIATARETTVSELVQTLAPILHRQGFDNFDVVHDAPLVGDVRRNFSDTSKAARLLGWNSQTALADGLEETVAWFCARAKRR